MISSSIDDSFSLFSPDVQLDFDSRVLASFVEFLVELVHVLVEVK